YEINRDAATFFYKYFIKKPNPGYNYMLKRGLEINTLRKFGIGYVDQEWSTLYNYFINKGEDPELLLSLGLISSSKGKYYDKYRNRVMFPIINTRGKVIGFGGRAIGDEVPKYLNSPESAIFHKKNNLYGLNLTRQDINREDYAILVEGYMDVISLYQHGIRNVSASLGTALTENQAAMLKRYTDHVVLAYDGDQAGQSAALRGMDILYAAGCKVKVLQLSDGADPDGYIKNNGKEAFLELVRQARPFVDYKLYLLRQKIKIDNTEGRVRFLKEAAEILKQLTPIEADAYIKKIAKQTKISEGAIRMEVDVNRHRESSGPVTIKEPREQGNLLEKNLIKLMVVKSSYIPKIASYSEYFRNPTYFRIYQVIKSLYRDDEEIDIKKVCDGLDEDENRVLKDIIENIHLADKDNEVFRDCIAHIEESLRIKREEEIIKLLTVLNDDSDRDKILALTKELMEIQSGKDRGDIKDEF
ncbi:MAG: DNA primase, partial [Eubacteriales bacterium]|nr:DNA primase [Eubacteriales bacterium]